LRLRFTLNFRSGADYLINSESCRALEGFYRSGSSIPKSLHVPAYFNAFQQASLRITMPIRVGLGFPEFTRFFNHSRLWKLRFFFVTAGCSTVELLRIKFLHAKEWIN
ncbi:MAG TPA: hypothetical protein VID27_05995, partial [Blastocatellia bacterium]